MEGKFERPEVYRKLKKYGDGYQTHTVDFLLGYNSAHTQEEMLDIIRSVVGDYYDETMAQADMSQYSGKKIWSVALSVNFDY